MSKQLGQLAVGDKIETPVNSANQGRFGAKIVWKVAAKGHSGYPSGSVTLIADKLIQIMAYDGKEASNTAVSARQTGGNNRYIYSNIAQWLNSDASAGAWYSARHSADAPPSLANINTGNAYDAWPGFLSLFQSKFLQALLPTTIKIVVNAKDGGGYETQVAKVFLASTTEVGLQNENGIAEGELLPLFSGNSSRLAYPTAECLSNSNGYTNTGYGNNKTWYWWLRTPYYTSAYPEAVLSVGLTGALNTVLADSAYMGCYGIRPLCNLSDAQYVSDTVNADGNYSLVFKTNLDFDCTVDSFSTRPAEAIVQFADADLSSAQSSTISLCNNFGDTAPVWEPIVVGQAHTFTNRSKSSGTWRVGVRVTALLGDDTLYCGEPIVTVRCDR